MEGLGSACYSSFDCMPLAMALISDIKSGPGVRATRDHGGCCS
jgi:hypothetical protein